MSVYSTSVQLEQIRDILSRYLRLPFSNGAVPGAIMEGVLAYVHGGKSLNTYDFVDVIHREKKIGWQVKSTKDQTPVTWKRAKIPHASLLIEGSKSGNDGCQKLGDAIIGFCNQHVLESIKKYDLDAIGYARLIVHENVDLVYFERPLVTKANPELFKASDFTWKWSEPKKTHTKEQLSALHGTHVPTQTKWWAAHMLGENQLHFSGEGVWWPPVDGLHRIAFKAPAAAEKLTVDEFMTLLAEARGS